MSPQSTLVVAATITNGIGVKGALPWILPNEMAYFARVTKSAGIPLPNPSSKINAVLMGRKTWESIPTRFRPLKDRLNVVVSSQKLDNPASSPVISPSFDSALSSLTQPTLRNVFIIGGASIYNQALEHPSTTRILLTRILEPAYDECDVFFPDFLKSGDWTKATHAELVQWAGFDVPEGVQEERGTKYEFQMWGKDSSKSSQ